MFNHEPPGYRCPFCTLVAGGENDFNHQQDVVRRTDGALAFVASRWWPNNQGHVLVVPTEHHENLYDLPSPAGHAVQDLVREVAIAIRSTYGCEGVSTRQHNEPAGYQDAWHYHVHVFPRYPDDNLYASRPLPTPPTAEQRAPYAEKLKTFFE
ncbi:diadenosine tetraphosphate hydrolase [Kribbella sp. ALI-6-A]|uniref:HIT family protein n=1 Tax=Kribbella sp. ALI-6-A TaxID=1933817 RepID=UPI00097C9BEA|nr:HIT domain-containing protein [Kribbella sp. ALI-6-A]ONI71764.1 diadenosine tetraphosphate hydrolase [Kribbella sp. ALI-6-A]